MINTLVVELIPEWRWLALAWQVWQLDSSQLKSLTTCSKDSRLLRRWKTRDKFSQTEARNQISCTLRTWKARDRFCWPEARNQTSYPGCESLRPEEEWCLANCMIHCRCG